MYKEENRGLAKCGTSVFGEVFAYAKVKLLCSGVKLAHHFTCL